VCGDEGLCEPVEVDERCSRTWPEDLFSAPENYTEHVLLGALFNVEDHFDTMQATELAFRQVTRRDEEAPAQFALVTCDASTPGETASTNEAVNAELAEYLAHTLGVPAIIGPRGSARTIAVWEQVGAQSRPTRCRAS
jgi:hypothetical protein